MAWLPNSEKMNICFFFGSTEYTNVTDTHPDRQTDEADGQTHTACRYRPAYAVHREAKIWFNWKLQYQSENGNVRTVLVCRPFVIDSKRTVNVLGYNCAMEIFLPLLGCASLIDLLQQFVQRRQGPTCVWKLL